MKKVLIVEDEIAYAKLLNDELTASGYQVITTDNGEKGLEIAKKELPDLILLDIRLPKMSGMDLLDALRKDLNAKSTKIIILTNLEPDDKIIGEILKDQPAYYFIKSNIKLNELKDKIKEVVFE